METDVRGIDEQETAGLHPLFRLGDLDEYDVEDDDSNIRGWSVMGRDGKKIGTVDELIVDLDAMKVRYLDVQLERSLLPGAEEPHLLVPIGVAYLDGDAKVVRLDTMDVKKIPGSPLYEQGPITRDYERLILKAHGRENGKSGHGDAEDFYEGEYFRDDRLFTQYRLEDPPDAERHLSTFNTRRVVRRLFRGRKE